MFKMHPDDLRDRDATWLHGPTPRLPRVLPRIGYIGFDGKERALKNDPLFDWSTEAGMCEAERMSLVLSWPDNGMPLQPYIDALARALDRNLGITGRYAEPKGTEPIPPAVSSPERGSCVNPHCVKPAMPGQTYCNGPCRAERRPTGYRTVRPFRCQCGGSWNQRAAPGTVLPCHRKNCNYMVQADKTPFENRQRTEGFELNARRPEKHIPPLRDAQLKALKRRSRDVEQRFKVRGFTTAPTTKLLPDGKEHMAVEILSYEGEPIMGCRAIVGAVWTLTIAEQWLDRNQLDRQSTWSDTAERENPFLRR